MKEPITSSPTRPGERKAKIERRRPVVAALATMPPLCHWDQSKPFKLAESQACQYIVRLIDSHYPEAQKLTPKWKLQEAVSILRAANGKTVVYDYPSQLNLGVQTAQNIVSYELLKRRKPPVGIIGGGLSYGFFPCSLLPEGEQGKNVGNRRFPASP